MPIAFLLNPGKTRKRPAAPRGSYRKLVEKYGVTEAAKRWKAKRKPKSTKRKVVKVAKKRRKSMAKKKRRNPTGTPKTAKGKAWRKLVKKHGVMKAAKIKRGRKRKYKAKKRKYTPKKKYVAKKRKYKAKKRKYASNKWAGQPRRHSKAAKKGWRKRRKYAKNPVSTVKAIITNTFSMKGAKDVAVVLGGLAGAVIGETVVTQKMGKTSDLAKFAGGASGAVITGGVIGIFTKDVALGTKAAVSGVSYAVFKLAYNKLLAGKPIFGMILPTVGDYVEIPAGTPPAALPQGISDWVEVPDVGQFEEEEAAVAPFLPQAMAGEEEQIDW